MAVVAGCPFKKVEPRERREPVAHTHSYPVEMATDEPGVIIRDCYCGHRERVRMRGRTVLEVLPDAVADGGSLANAVYVQDRPAHFSDRWTSTNKEI